jgi:hypothetical protein
MDQYQSLQRAGTITEPSPEVFARAQQILLDYMAAEGMPVVPRSHRRLLAVSVIVAVAAAVVAGAVLLPTDRGTRPHKPGQVSRLVRAPVQLNAQTVALISAQSAAAVADSGTAVETTSNSTGVGPPSTPQTIAVTFSGQDVNYLITSNGNGAEGVQNRVVDGQLYLYIKGPDLQMHWYHDTAANAAASDSYPDPRTLLQAISPSAGLEDLGMQSVDGLELTHLRATDPASIESLHIPDVADTVTAFDVWVDAHNVVRQIRVTSSSAGNVSGPGTLLCEKVPSAAGSTSLIDGATPIPPSERISTLPDGQAVPAGTICGDVQNTQLRTTLNIQFVNLGVPESVTAPLGAIDQEGLG